MAGTLSSLFRLKMKPKDQQQLQHLLGVSLYRVSHPAGPSPLTKGRQVILCASEPEKRRPRAPSPTWERKH